jgi:hypothetical protein
MTTFERHISTCAILLFLMTPAAAQMPAQRVVPDQTGVGSHQEASVRIQTNMNFFVPGPTGEGEEAQKLRDRARRIIYETAARECELLRETLAKDCRMESVNSNINTNRQFAQFGQQQQQEGYTVNGSMSFQITLK